MIITVATSYNEMMDVRIERHVPLPGGQAHYVLERWGGPTINSMIVELVIFVGVP